MDDFLDLKPTGNIHSYTELIKQESCGNCYCCLAENNLKSMLSTYYFKGKAEVYSEMMIYCFSIELLSDNGENIGIENVYQICETCICRLRDACFFKNKIETTQESLRKISDFTEGNHDLKDEAYDNNADTDFFKAVVSLDSLKSENTDEEFNSTVIKKKVKKKKYSKEKKNIKKRKLENNVLTNLKNYKSFQKLNCLTDSNVEKLNVIENSPSSENSPVKRNKVDKSSYKLSKDAVTCKICNETFPLHNALVRHMPIHFPNHICHICAKVYDSNIKLICHIKRHEQPKHMCDICHKTYKGLDNLKNHMRQHSKPSNVYKCPLCPERFSVYYKRVKHLVNVHNDEPKKYKCKQCPKRYFQSCTLKSHIKRVHLQERSCICSECGDAFYDKSGLTEHMLKHTGIKNFQCDICQKSYARRYTLNEHMRIHTNDKRFVCSFCGRAFTQKCTLKAHLKTHEKQQASSE